MKIGFFQFGDLFSANLNLMIESAEAFATVVQDGRKSSKIWVVYVAVVLETLTVEALWPGGSIVMFCR